MKLFILLIILFCNFNFSFSQSPFSKRDFNDLPKLMKLENGKYINSLEDWENIRKNEILYLFREYIYGNFPFSNEINIKYNVVSDYKLAFKGRAYRKIVDILIDGNNQKRKIRFVLYVPSFSKEKVPAFLAYDFWGDKAIVDDLIGREYSGKQTFVEKIIENGLGVITLSNDCLYKDDRFNDSFDESILPLFTKQKYNNLCKAIGTWAWGMSCIMDYLIQDTKIDCSKIALLGHSRLGKTALWAGAQDSRFAVVISNCSGCMGAALSRSKQGESVKIISEAFPHWFCENFYKFEGREKDLPIDQHMLVALIAPRPVYIASASKDFWADPTNEFFSGIYATPVYNLYNLKGLEISEFPRVGEVVGDNIKYVICEGEHNLTDYNINCYIDFVKKYFDK